MHSGLTLCSTIFGILLSLEHSLNPKGHAPSNPCQKGWHYLDKYGLCYHGIKDRVFTMEDAREACHKLKQQESSPPVLLAQFHELKMFEEIEKIVGTDNLPLPIWVGAYRTGTQLHFHWLGGSKLANLDFLSWEGDAGSDDCMKIIDASAYFGLPTKLTVLIADCSSEATALCQQEDIYIKHTPPCVQPAPRCVDPPGDFDAKTMTFSPHPPFVGTTVQAICQPGYSQETTGSTGPRATTPDVNSKLAQGHYECTRPTDKSGIPMAPEFTYSGLKVKACIVIVCPNPKIPKHAKITSENPDLKIAYMNFADEGFHNFGNIATISCNKDYMLPNRQPDLKLKCSIDPTDPAKGIYTTLSGQAPNIPVECISSTCLANEVSIKPTHNVQQDIQLTKPGAQPESITTHSVEKYPVETKLDFTCTADHVTYQNTTNFTIVCGDQGEWNPKFVGCVRLQELLPLGHDGKFGAEIKEGQSARRLSTILLGCMIVLIGLIIALDCLTCPRDSRRLWQNLELNKLRWQRVMATKKTASGQKSPSVSTLDDFKNE